MGFSLCQYKNEINMKKLLTLLLFGLITSSSFGQYKTQDIIYLKNGKIIQGTIIEKLPNKYLKIETTNNQVLVLEIDEIERISFESTRVKNNNDNSNAHSKFKGLIEMGILKANHENQPNFTHPKIKLNVVAGYQINPYINLGLGTGLRYDLLYQWSTVPLFVNFKANILNNKRFSPYISFGVGRTFVLDEFDGISYLLDPSIGVSIERFGKWRINIALNYELDYIEMTVNNKNEHGPLCVLMGISF